MSGPATISIQRVDPTQLRDKPTAESALGFGRIFTDHLFLSEYRPAEGWSSPRIEAMRKLQLHPAAMCLHYGQEVFEGLKAYRGKDQGIYLFRWQKNAERMARSCERLMMPPVDVELFGRAIQALTLLERDWVPADPSCSLYIRPTVIATDPFLGVRPSHEYTFFVIAGPVGAYYPEGINPVSIWVSEQDVRAAQGGLGEAKTAANYAASLQGQSRATKLGHTQVLWLDAKEHQWIEEVGTMNIFCRIKDEVITPPLAGTILPGVTRDSVLQICRHWGLKVKERMISIDELVAGIRSGDVREVWGTGTAAVVSPVGVLSYAGEEVIINDRKIGGLSQRLYDYLSGLQRGEEEDPFGWVERIDGLDAATLAAGRSR